ncbi:putative cytosolic endo-beta-N-acetylglucosaminidase [Scophthalmus maximus]|uniref:Cytosolic endo-beta-N-acetylglucosaminidase n=1 Tax=Scophthalmus maximus TaxID=52904 RepID=A0A2U9CV29_SCOMX|nr:putative cytosolic endo-beta-N-acetylglucosaminidase [Scophthalmus maximus]
MKTDFEELRLWISLLQSPSSLLSLSSVRILHPLPVVHVISLLGDDTAGELFTGELPTDASILMEGKNEPHTTARGRIIQRRRVNLHTLSPLCCCSMISCWGRISEVKVFPVECDEMSHTSVDGNKRTLRRKRKVGGDNNDGGGRRAKAEPSRYCALLFTYFRYPTSEVSDQCCRQNDRDSNALESCLDQPMDSNSIHEVVKFIPSLLPANHYDADTTEPISCGLQTLDELLSWKRNEANPFNAAVVPLAPREPSLASSSRRTLVSHDMMGGYLDDRFVQGTSSEAPYAFYHWQYIDIFNYFTHKMVTVPPAVWTSAAHKHGVVVLGTFITEWTDGYTACEAFLKEEESYRAVADKLVQISHYYGFDGWLINIENPLSEVAVKNTPLFLRYLTDQMHERVSGSLVLWYDSVIETGRLNWQNELNQSNKMFFDACDGFFTNYNWTEQHLEGMKEYGGVQGREADVYIGVDVFGRGNVVGGMFETNKALDIIRKHNFSAAIFAPGWVYECHADKTEFRKNQDKFWALLSDNLYVHRPASSLPFISSFCQGFGKALYWRGKHERDRSWFNLTAQELQPMYYRTELEDQGWLRSRGCPDDAWNGGCSLLLEGLIPLSHTSPVSAKIFSLHVPLPSKILVSLIFKPSAGITVSLELKTADASLCDNQDVKLTSVRPEVLDEGHQLVSQFTQLCGNLNPDGWTMRCLQSELRGCTLREVCVSIQRRGEAQDTPFSCRLGQIMLLDVASLQAPPELVQGLCIYDVVWLRGTLPESDSPCLHLNATLRWDYPAKLVRHSRVYWRRLSGPDPPGQLVLLGRAYSNLFRVTELAVPEPPSLLELVVEPVMWKGFLVPENQWGKRSLSYNPDVTK